MSGDRADVLRDMLHAWMVAGGSENVEAARDALNKLVSAHHPDCEIDFSRTLPDFAPTRGPEAMATWIWNTRDNMVDDVTLRPGEFVELGDTVIAPVQVTGRVRGSQAPIDMSYAYVVRFRGDKIASSTTYQTLSEALEAARSAS